MIGRIHVEVHLDPPYGFPQADGSTAQIASSVIPIGELGQIYDAFEQARRQLVGHVVGASQEVAITRNQELHRLRDRLEDEKIQHDHARLRVRELEEALEERGRGAS